RARGHLLTPVSARRSVGAGTPRSTARPRAHRGPGAPGRRDGGTPTVPAPCDTDGRAAGGEAPPRRCPGPGPAWVRGRTRGDTGPVGFNPFRQHRRSAADIAMVAGALIVCALFVAWAAFG